MSISAASASAFTRANVQTEVAYAVAKKSLDAQEQQGEAALALLNDAAALAKRGPSAPGKGVRIDVTG